MLTQGMVGPARSAVREGCVVVCSDARWAWQGAFVLHRSILHDTARQLDHHAYIVGPVSDELLAAFPKAATVHRLADYPDEFSYAAGNHVPKAAMLRVFALADLAGTYRRILYLDGDVFQDWGSLGDLLSLPETGRPLAAVRDRSHWFDRPLFHEQKAYVARLNPKIGAQYFNSGVMLVNGPVWAQGQYSSAVMAFFRENPALCRYGDQSALNGVIAGNWDSLSPGWNWQMSKTSYPLLAGRRPRLVHFTGTTKPWSDRLRLFDQSVFRQMKAFLAERGLEHVLDADTSPDGFSAAQERSRMRALAGFAEGVVDKREKIKRFLDAPDHVDIAQGLRAYGLSS